jgi:hypothetical protein
MVLDDKALEKALLLEKIGSYDDAINSLVKAAEINSKNGLIL